ncbi:ester cyclase [Serratia sp. DD3]|uniref:ester cyclase n=1 Tax=Serratia sp. DD3 TaxID=1410619 RepID=UPI0003C52D17|nr:ester cyclase [Serratia sp. DD3]KEY57602.1 putative ester cyclase [Serratia sp. DD3]
MTKSAFYLRLVCGATLLTSTFVSLGLQAKNLAPAEAQTIVAPFYDALNAAPGKNAEKLVLQATAPEWVSCSGNDECKPREKVAAGIAGFGKVIPNLKWEIKELLVDGNRIIVRGEASGTPATEFMGVPYGGKSFKIMSIDIHTVKNGKIERSYHVEDWMSAVRQLSAK